MSDGARTANDWRRIARLGAAVCCLATLLPTYGDIGSQWNMGVLRLLGGSWFSNYQSAPDPKSVFVPVMTVILTFFLASLVAPVFFLFATGPWMTRVSKKVTVSTVVLLAQLGFFAFVPGNMLLNSLPHAADNGFFTGQTLDNATIWAIGFTIFLTYQFLIGLSILLWRDKRGTAWELLPLAALPFALCVLRWICMLTISIYRDMPAIFVGTAVVYLAGATMLGIGCVQAFRASHVTTQRDSQQVFPR